MTATQRVRKKYFKLSAQWHRRIGILISIPCVLIALSGILLNHAELLSLDRIHIRNPWLLSLYGMTPTTDILAAEVGVYEVATLEASLFVNGTLIDKSFGSLTGAIVHEDLLVLASTEHVLLLAVPELAMLEKLDSSSLPQGEIRGLGTENNRVLLESSSGLYAVDTDFTQFEKLPQHASLPQFQTTAPAEAMRELILAEWRGEGLSLWRIILDLHSGRLFSSLGTLVADIAALCIILLVISGFYNASGRKRRL